MTTQRSLTAPSRLVLAIFFVGLSAPAGAHPPAEVRVLGQHQNSEVVYHYTVANTMSRGIWAFTIGCRTDEEKAIGGELMLDPVGAHPVELPGGGIDVEIADALTQPEGWKGELLGVEESMGSQLFWHVLRDKKAQHGLMPSQTLSGFSVRVPAIDLGYVKGHFCVARLVDGKLQDYMGQIEAIDTAPPALSVTASPTAIWPPSNKPAAINISINVTDDHDPAPEIKLVSITANEPLSVGDIVDAQFGTDDRQFGLVATRKGNNLAGRTYTITYSASDASGNKSIGSTTVSVPHDQGK